MIILGQRYSSDRLHYMSRIVLMLFISLLVSLFANFIMFPNPIEYRYIPISNTGLVLPQVPRSQPNHDDKYVTDWTVDAVTRLYSFDFVNYREQLQEAQRNLTISGWKSFETAMNDSGNFKAIIGNRFVLTAVPTGAGRVTAQGLIDGKEHSWTVEFPMLISYRSSIKDAKGNLKVTTQALKMAITVVRVPVFLNHTGLGIRAIVGEV
jgi:intracellular multiplication protein IcmL